MQSFTEQLQLLKSGSNAELKAIMLMPEATHMKRKYTKCFQVFTPNKSDFDFYVSN